METVIDFIFLGSQITVDGDHSHEIKRCLLCGGVGGGEEPITNLDSVLKSRQHFADKGPGSQNYGFSCSHVWMWEFDHKEGWALKNWCLWTVVLEVTLESPLDSKIKPSILKEINPEYSLKVLTLKLKVQDFGHLMWRADSPDARKDWGQEEKGVREDMVGCHHRLNGYEFEQTPWDSERQGSLAWFIGGRVRHDL